MMLYFYLGCFLSWFAVLLSKVQYSCDIKGNIENKNVYFYPKVEKKNKSF